MILMRRKNMDNKKNNFGITPIIATVLLLAMAIGLFSVLNIIVFSFPINPRSPSVSLVASVIYDNRDDTGYNEPPVSIIIEHKGGEALHKNDIQINITIIPNPPGPYTIKDGIFSDDTDDDLFSIGDYWICNTGLYLKDRHIYASVVHLATNSILMMGTIQEGD